MHSLNRCSKILNNVIKIGQEVGSVEELNRIRTSRHPEKNNHFRRQKMSANFFLLQQNFCTCTVHAFLFMLWNLYFRGQILAPEDVWVQIDL